jgi:protease-4
VSYGSPQPAPTQQIIYAAPPRRRGFGGRFLTAIVILLFMLSIILNFALLAAAATKTQISFSQTTIRDGDEKNAIAVYDVTGVIFDQAAQNFAKFAREVKADKNIKAIVLRVNSPGGGVNASDEIYKSVQDLKAAGKKVVVSMGSVAASGGYYISAPADQIYAEPTTITGSVGVIMEWFVLKGTLDKIGVQSVVMKSTDAQGWKDEGSPFAQPPARQREHLQYILDQMQARFEKVVREGRGDRLKTRETQYATTVPAADGKTEEKQVKETEPLNGKIYLADDAKERGLVDQIGYQSDAIDAAAKLANISNPAVIKYERRHGLFEALNGNQASTSLSISRELIDDLQTQRVLVLWKGE